MATSQTIAMTDRLQEENAAMQMEDLLYRRMMEQKSEYDQEVFNFWMILWWRNRRKKQEIEKELEGFEKKLLDYEDSDELSVDLNQAAKEKEEFF